MLFCRVLLPQPNVGGTSVALGKYDALSDTEVNGGGVTAQCINPAHSLLGVKDAAVDLQLAIWLKET